MMKVIISQPMAGKTDEEIAATREKAAAVLRGMGFEVVDSLFEGEFYSDEQIESRGVVQIPLYFLAKSEAVSLSTPLLGHMASTLSTKSRRIPTL